MANKTINFKDPLWFIAWLDTALEKEKEKYEQCPVKSDLVPGHEVAQAWGYVVAGYFLVEESFKALLYLRGKKVPTKHSLTMLFNLFEPGDKKILRAFCKIRICTWPAMGFPLGARASRPHSCKGAAPAPVGR